MKIKVKSTQIYEDYKETQEEIYKDSDIKILDKSILINYNEVEIVWNKEEDTIEIKRPENSIFINLNKQNEFAYETPYGKTMIKTFGEKIAVNEKPFNMIIEYKIILGNMAEYKNIIEILEL